MRAITAAGTAAAVVVVLLLISAQEGEAKKHAPIPTYSFKVKEDIQPKFEFSVHPTSLPEGGGSVTVTWNNSFFADEDAIEEEEMKSINAGYHDWNNERNDLVAISCGDKQHHGDVFDVFLLAERHQTALSIPLRHLSFCDWKIEYFRRYNRASKLLKSNNNNEGEYEFVLLQSKTVKILGHDKPRHMRLALADAPSEMWVSYTSKTNSSHPTVRFGKTQKDLNFVAVSQDFPISYSADDLCDAPANVTAQKNWRFPGFFNHVKIVGLEKNTTYYYQVGNEEQGFSEILSFVSPIGGGEGEVTRFVGFGDMGAFPQEPAALLVMEAIARHSPPPSFVAHFGDISYARGHGFIWDEFFSQVKAFAQHVPYMVSVGNHETDVTYGAEKDPSGLGGWHPDFGNMGNDSGGECAVPVYKRFRSPSNGHSIFWYSFDYGLVHTIMLSSEHPWVRGSDQYKWLESDLASVNRTITPWIVLTTHRMMYPTQLKEDGDYKVSLVFREEMDDLLEKYKVNLVLEGHQHSYERSLPILHSKIYPADTAPVHVIVGTAGAGLESGGFSAKFGNWSAFNTERHHGYCYFEATRQSLKIQLIALGEGVIDEHKLGPWV